MVSLRQLFKLWLLLAVAVSLTACSATPIIQDYSSQTQFENHQTYQWLPSHTAETTLYNNQPFLAKRIEQAIVKNLTQRGSLIVRQQPQAYISYGYEVFRTETLEPRTTLGLGWGFRHFGFRTAFPIDYETQVYKEALWSVNIYDQNQKLIWQGKTQRSVKQFSKPQEAEAYTQEVIDSILNEFPPQQS